MRIPKIGFCVLLMSIMIVGVVNAEGSTEAAKEAQVADAIEEADAVEVLEEVPVVEMDSTDGSAKSDQDISILDLIGRHHAAAVHFPIGLIVGVFLLELLGLFFPKLPLGKSGLVLSFAVVASLIPAAISGWLRSKEVYAESAPTTIFFEHRNLVLVAVTIFIVGLGLRLFKKDNMDGRVRWIYFGILSVSVLLLAAGGHFGGQLVYGENFLPY